MTFVDTNVFMYAVGRLHPLQSQCRRFFAESVEKGTLVTSAEVLQELLHAYLPVDRLTTLDRALSLARASCSAIWAVEPNDVIAARQLIATYPQLGSRDLLHLAMCRRHRVSAIETHDRGLRAAFAI